MSNSQANSFVNIYPEDWTPDNPELTYLRVRYDQFVQQLFKADTYREMLWHAQAGVADESGELAGAIKKHLAYGKPLDFKNVIEEIGDLRFYLQAIQNLLGITEQQILQANADKLSERYRGLRYSDEAAIARADKKGSEGNG